MRNIKYILLAFVLFACQPEIDDFKTSKADLDLSNYVAVGNSLTAGYANSALYKSGQEVAYPNLLANQLKKVGGGEFKTPFVESEYGIAVGATPMPKLILGFAPGESTPSPAPSTKNISDLEVLGSKSYASEVINNFGVPGAKVAHLLAPGYGNPAGLLTKPATANPYFVRFASSTTSSVIADVVAKKPTFFSLWIGNNDVLGYATAGGVGEAITDLNDFKTYYTGVIGQLTSQAKQGVVANLPDVTATAHFTYVKPNQLPLDVATATQLNAAFAQYNAGAVAAGLAKVEFKESPSNYFLIETSEAQYAALGGMRQATDDDLMLLTIPSDSVPIWLAKGKPVPSKYVLDKAEVAKVKAATKDFNDFIKQTAESKSLAHVDFNSKLNTIKEKGVVYDGLKFTTDYITGNVFSLDGIHLTPRGNALVANYFIEAIDAKYGTSIPRVNLTLYSGVRISLNRRWNKKIILSYLR